MNVSQASLIGSIGCAKPEDKNETLYESEGCEAW